MSSTRKIEGWVSKDVFTDPSNKGCAFGMEMRPMLCDMSATLIIGGKGYTEEEVKAFINDMKDQTMSIAVEQSIDRIAAKHGITLP